MSPLYLPICGILLPFKANLYVPSPIFKINFSFVCSYRSRSGEGWLIFSMLDVLFSRWVFIHLSLHESKAKVLGMPSPQMKNDKFLGKCWYGGHPWIRLAMESESMVEKGINFIFCLGTAYDISIMESVGNSKSFSLVGWIHLRKCFISKFFTLSSGTSTNPYFPPRRAFLFTLCNFYFGIWVSIFSYKKH